MSGGVGVIEKFGYSSGKVFYKGLVGESAIFLNDPVYQEIRNSRKINLNIDGTFSIVPNLYKQLLVILVEKEDRVSILKRIIKIVLAHKCLVF